MSDAARRRLARAEAEALAARAQLATTLEQIQGELSPANLAGRALDELRERSQAFTDTMLAGLFSRPMLATLLASLLGMLVRHRPTLETILRFLIGLTGGRKSKTAPKRNTTPEEETLA